MENLSSLMTRQRIRLLLRHQRQRIRKHQLGCRQIVEGQLRLCLLRYRRRPMSLLPLQMMSPHYFEVHHNRNDHLRRLSPGAKVR